MTNTAPRQLSDAVKADYETILSNRPVETSRIRAWKRTRLIAAAIGVGVIVGWLALLTVSVAVGSFIGISLALLTGAASPFILVPALLLCVTAQVAIYSLERKRREAIFTLYGITIDDSITPPVYALAIPHAWVKPELAHTREVLNLDPSSEADPEPDETPDPEPVTEER